MSKIEGFVASCETCRFRRGSRCCRFPPQSFVYTVSRYQSDDYIDSLWDFPAVDNHAWCGEYWEASEPDRISQLQMKKT